MINRKLLKIWLLATLVPVYAAAFIRLVWEVTVNPSVDGIIMTVLISLVIFAGLGFTSYFIFRPDLKKLTGLPAAIIAVFLGTFAIIGSYIHFSRFYLSPQFGWPWSLVIALLFVFAATSAYFLLLWIIWSFRKNRDPRE